MFELRDQIILWWLLVLTSAYWLHIYWRRCKTGAYLDDGESPPEPASHDESLPYQKNLGRCIEQAMRRPGDVTVAGQSPAAYGNHAAESPSAVSTARG